MNVISKQRLFLAALGSAALLANAASSDIPSAPLFDGLGQLHHPVSTHSAAAQRYFDQGLTLCYAFNHTEAIRSFQAAALADPDCAMAYWGMAFARGPHVNKPMTKEDNDRACEALAKAVDARSKASPKDKAFIDALAERYKPGFTDDHSALDKAYANAMRGLAKQFPDDLDAQVLFAEALMDTMPWDYWSKDRGPKPETEEVIAALKYVLARNPDHPGANHFYIHAVEAGPTPEAGLPAADRLAKLVPQAGHLVHMPSHIYMRVGQYHDAVRANEEAIQADQSYLRACRAQGFYPGAYYPHNIHFLWYATVFEGRSAEALAAATKATQYAMDNSCGPNQALEAPRFRHLPWLTKARFGRWDEILSVPQPPATNSFLVDRIMWHFTRGLAYSARGALEEARREQSEMTKLIHSDEIKALGNPHFPVTAILAVAEHLLAGKVAGLSGDKNEMIQQLEQAVAAEDALPYMEPAYWPFPTRPTLGAALLQADQPAKAEAVFREDLQRFPRNGWGLLGLEQSLRRQGKTDSAESVRIELDQAWQRADVKLDLAWF
jgi:tetratricopeptide (TPR) repeat protein